MALLSATLNCGNMVANLQDADVPDEILRDAEQLYADIRELE